MSLGQAPDPAVARAPREGATPPWRRGWVWVGGLVIAMGLVWLGLSSLHSERPADFKAPHVRPVEGEPAADGSVRAMYVPVYSHVYHGGGRTHLLEVMLSIRNLEVRRPLRVESVKYYDTSGRFLRSFLKSPIEIGPLGTAEYLISQDDITGGSGANFIVTWTPAAEDAHEPLMQTVMVGRDGDRSFSFVCTGVPIDEAPDGEGATGDAPQRGD